MSSHTDTTLSKEVRERLFKRQQEVLQLMNKNVSEEMIQDYMMEFWAQEIQKAREEERKTIKLKVREQCTAPLDGVTDQDQRTFRMGINECKARVIGIINSLSHQSKEKV